MKGSVVQTREAQQLLMQVLQGDLVWQASQPPAHVHLSDEECLHGPWHDGAVEPQAFALKTRLNIGENGQSLLDGSLKAFWPVARSTKMRP
jgi:hypothetical protein